MKEGITNYTKDQLAHTYACWAAARAASIGRHSNQEIANFIEKITLKEAVDEQAMNEGISPESFRDWFTKKVDELNKHMKRSGKNPNSKHRKGEFGIAAKVISIYLKTYVVLPDNGNSKLATLVYPPIDSILLKNKELKQILGLQYSPWSKFSKSEYFKVLDKLLAHAKCCGVLPWQLEYYWQPNKK